MSSTPSANETRSIKDLQIIPGIGKSLAIDLYELGVRKVTDLKGKDPQQLYDKHCELRGAHIDRCVLYVFRCAVYFAETKNPEPEKLKWWNWSGRTK